MAAELQRMLDSDDEEEEDDMEESVFNTITLQMGYVYTEHGAIYASIFSVKLQLFTYQSV